MNKCLNLGCGNDIIKSTDKSKWINLDKVKLNQVDIIHDINKIPFPFKDNEFDLIKCSHVLEHVEDLEKVLIEISRITKKNGIIHINVPHFSCGVSYRDPTHKRLFSYFTFDYYTNDCFYTNVKFKIISRKLNFTRENFTFLNVIFNPLINLSPTLYERLFCWIFPSAEIIFKLKPLK